MAKQTNKSTKNSVAHKSVVDVELEKNRLERERKQLLAQMATRIVTTVMEDPSPSTTTPEAFAEVAVDIAEAILQKVGL